jgi:hypothetical protein
LFGRYVQTLDASLIVVAAWTYRYLDASSIVANQLLLIDLMRLLSVSLDPTSLVRSRRCAWLSVNGTDSPSSIDDALINFLVSIDDRYTYHGSLCSGLNLSLNRYGNRLLSCWSSSTLLPSLSIDQSIGTYHLIALLSVPLN